MRSGPALQPFDRSERAPTTSQSTSAGRRGCRLSGSQHREAHWSVLLSGLLRLYERAGEASAVRIALIDGLVKSDHPAFAGSRIERPSVAGLCLDSVEPDAHATFVASMLVGGRDVGLALVPNAVLINICVVDQQFRCGRLRPSEAAHRLRAGVAAAVAANADVIQMSFDFSELMDEEFEPVADALRSAAGRGVSAVISAGDRPVLAVSQIYGSARTVPVVATNPWGRLRTFSPMATALAAKGLRAPGEDLPGAALEDSTVQSGSSLAASFVTGAFALLCAAFPERSRDEIWYALLNPQGSRTRRCALIPPLLDAESAAEQLERRSS